MSHHSPLPPGEGMEHKTILPLLETAAKMENGAQASDPVNEGSAETNKLKGSAFCNFRDTIIISSCGSGLSNESTRTEKDILSERFNAAAIRIKTEKKVSPLFSIKSSPKNEQKVNSSIHVDNNSDIIVVDVEDEKINIIDSETPAVANMENQNMGASDNVDPNAAIEISSSNCNSLRKFSPYRNGMSISISQRKPIERTNKSRTDSTGDFPVSDSSFQGKRKRRLSTDLFEFRLFQLDNLRLTIQDKIEAWNSSDVVSEIEDVVNFEKDFAKYEIERRNLIESGTMPTDLKDFRLYSNTITDKSNLQENNPDLPSTSGVIKRQKLLQESNDYRARLQETGQYGKPSSYEDSTSTEGRVEFARKKRTNLQFITQVNENGKHPAIKENTIEDKNAKTFANTNTTSADNGNKCDNNIALISKSTGLNNNTKRLIETFWDFTQFKENFHLKEHADKMFKSRIRSNSNDYSGSESNHKDSNSDDTGADYSNELSTSLSNEHQQQEFYTYLGLTDTSNMNAITSASAELATSHLQRRSLRVRRMQLDKEKNINKDKKSYKISRPNKSRIKKAKDKQENERINKPPTLPKPFDIPNKQEAKIKIQYQFSSNDNTENNKSKSTTPLTIPHLERQQKPGRNSTPETSTCPRSSFSDRGGGSIKSEYYRVQNGVRLLVTPPLPITRKLKLFPRSLQCCQGDCGAYLPTTNNVTLRNSILPISRNISLNNTSLLYQVQRRAVLLRTPDETSCTPSSLQPIQKNDVTSVTQDESSFVTPQKSTTNVNSATVKKFSALDYERSIDLLQKIIPHEQSYNCTELLEKVQTKYRLLVASVQNQESKSIIVEQFSSKKELQIAPITTSDKNKTETGTQTAMPLQQSVVISPPPVQIPSEFATITLDTAKSNDTESSILMRSKTNLVNGVVSKRNPRARLSKLMTSGHFRLSLQKTLRSRKVIILQTIRKNKKNKKKKTVDENFINASKLIEQSPSVSEKNSSELQSLNNSHEKTPNATILVSDDLVRTAEVNSSQAVVENTNVNSVKLININPDTTIEIIDNNNVVPKGDELMINKDLFMSSDIIVETKDIATQCESHKPDLPVKYITRPPPDPKIDINNEKGKILHIFFESDILIVVQEHSVSFWKYSKLVNTLIDSVEIICNANPQQLQTTDNIELQNITKYTKTSTAPTSFDEFGWLRLGCSNRTVDDTEVKVIVSNRICTTITTNTMYLELRGKLMDSPYRTCDLVCMYIKIYFYSDECGNVGVHQINLDTLQSRFDDITYTCIPDSGYFVVSWYQQIVGGKNRSGICKYAISPRMDSLASIRDFKNISHKILQLQCLNDDKLVGFGKTAVTIWNHRSGDTLYNYDLSLNLGFNLGTLYFTHNESDNNRMFVMLQHLINDENKSELLVLACTLTEANPTHRILKRLPLSEEDFGCVINATKTSEYVIVQGKSNAELWINSSNPNMLVWVPAPKNARRFYRNGQKQVIQFNGENLVVDTIANLMLKLATSFDATQV